MTDNSRRSRMVIAGTAIATAILLTLAAPAQADDRTDKTGPESCWIQADTGTTRCYVDTAAMRADQEKVTGGPLIEDGSAQARLTPGQALASGDFLLARLYSNTSWGGSFIEISSSSSTFCLTGGSISRATMQSGWNDVISSVHTWNNCVALLYENSNFGSLLGTYTNPSTLGSANDRTSSYKVQ